jgi:hypothetical protein
VRKVLIASGIFFLLFFYGLILSQTHLSAIPEELEPKNPSGFYDYRGISNVHSERGLGSGSALDVIRAAQEANLDYLIMTDLNAFGDSSIPDSYHRKLLFISAAEYSYLDSRLIHFDLQKAHSLEGLGQAQLLLADLLSQSDKDSRDDLIVLAHPLKPGYQWNGAIPAGLDGIEVINLKSLWRQAWEANKISFLWSAIVYPFNSDLALLRLYDEPAEELQLWDQLSAVRHTVGMAGAEATAKTSPVGDAYLRFPSYQTSFSFISNHVLLRSELTGEAEGDRKKILTALNEGQFYMSLDVIGNPKGFSTYISQGEQIFPLGSRVKLSSGMKVMIHLPAKPKGSFEAVLFKDGQRYKTSNDVDSAFEITEPGVYRVIVRTFLNFTLPDGNRWITWIYTNPFYVR